MIFCISQTQQLLLIHKNNYLGLYVSTLTESSSGPLKYRSKISYVYNALWDPQRWGHRNALETPLILVLSPREPEDDSERVEICNPNN